MSNKNIIPVVKAEEEAEEEIVDPQTQLKRTIIRFGAAVEHLPSNPKLKFQEVCSQKADAQNQWSKYQECNDRVNSRSQTAETCEEELIDYIQILDKCVTKDLFKRLK